VALLLNAAAVLSGLLLVQTLWGDFMDGGVSLLSLHVRAAAAAGGGGGGGSAAAGWLRGVPTFPDEYEDGDDPVDG
jgi:hypothetical protein